MVPGGHYVLLTLAFMMMEMLKGCLRCETIDWCVKAILLE
jgi:hypothetical protein